MSKPWMPLYVAEYKKDTGHLSTEQHGAYMLLIMHYWATGGLPDDDAQLARITCMSLASWKRTRPIIVPFFHDGWKHKRIDRELTHAENISSKRTAAANQRHGKLDANAGANVGAIAMQLDAQSPSQSHLQQKELSNFSKVGEKKANGWSPPRHGATSTQFGTVYVRKGTSEWEAYADDHRKTLGSEPVADDSGGKWFPVAGATTIPPPKRQQVRA